MVTIYKKAGEYEGYPGHRRYLTVAEFAETLQKRGYRVTGVVPTLWQTTGDIQEVLEAVVIHEERLKPDPSLPPG